VSAHLLGASPTAHRLEYLNTAGAILKDPIRIEDGHAVVPEGPGIGLEWDEEAVGRYLSPLREASGTVLYAQVRRAASVAVADQSVGLHLLGLCTPSAGEVR
jgi:hypothetical protein